MGLGKHGLAVWATVVVVAMSSWTLVHAQVASPAQPNSTNATTPSKPPTAKPTSATKPAAKPAKPAATSRTPAKPKTPPTTATKGRSTSAAKPAATTSKPAGPPKAATPKPAPASSATAAAPAPQPATAVGPKPPASAPVMPNSAAPPQATPLRDAAPTATALPGAPAPALPFRQRHPLVGGFLAGLLGVGLADALLGPDVPDTGLGQAPSSGNVLEPIAAGLGTAEVVGQLLRLAFFGALVALAVMLYRRRVADAPALGAGRSRNAPGLAAWDEIDRPVPEPEPASLARSADLRAIADEQDFADILRAVQAAWSEGDVMAMRGHITPDMASYFDRRLAQNADGGIENRVVGVSNVHVEPITDWEEDGVHYAKARMNWSALDYVVDSSKLPDESGYIVDGSPEQPIDCEEVWTFAKSPDGAWVLCEVEEGG